MRYFKVCIKQGVGNIANDSQSVGKMGFLAIILQLFYLLRIQTRIPSKTMYDLVTEKQCRKQWIFLYLLQEDKEGDVAGKNSR